MSRLEYFVDIDISTWKRNPNYPDATRSLSPSLTHSLFAMNINHILRSRESSAHGPSPSWTTATTADLLYDADYFKRRLTRSHHLEGHRGCVNAIAWDCSGRWMVSGSDDLQLLLWAPFHRNVRSDSSTSASSTSTSTSTAKPYLLASVPTAHPSNIFSCKFASASHSMDGKWSDLGNPPMDLISCSADGLVQYTDLRGFFQDHAFFHPNRGFKCHSDMVFDVEPDPLTNGSLSVSVRLDRRDRG